MVQWFRSAMVQWYSRYRYKMYILFSDGAESAIQRIQYAMVEAVTAEASTARAEQHKNEMR